MFHWSICLFLCQYHTVFITVALLYGLKSGRMILLAFFPPMIALAIRSLLWLHTYFRFVCFFCFCKECHWYFDGDCVDSVEGFGYQVLFLFSMIETANCPPEKLFSPFIYGNRCFWQGMWPQRIKTTFPSYSFISNGHVSKFWLMDSELKWCETSIS